MMRSNVFSTAPRSNKASSTSMVDNFAGALITLTVASGLIAWVLELANTSRDQGLWFFVLVAMVWVSALYSVVFALMAGRRSLPWRYVVGFNGLLGLVLLFLPALFYLVPASSDWAAGLVPRALKGRWLSLGVWLGIYLVFLATHGLVLYLRGRANGPSFV